MNQNLEKRVEQLEKKVAELECLVQAQQKEFIPSTSEGLCTGELTEKHD